MVYKSQTCSEPQPLHPLVGYVAASATAVACYILSTAIVFLCRSPAFNGPEEPIVLIGIAILLGLFGFTPSLVS